MRFMIAFSHTATCKCRCQPSCCRGTLVVTVIGWWRFRLQPVTAHRFAAEHVSPRCLPTGEGRQRYPQPRRRWQLPILHDLQICMGSFPILTKICTCGPKWWPTRGTVRFFLDSVFLSDDFHLLWQNFPIYTNAPSFQKNGFFGLLGEVCVRVAQ